MITTRNSMLAPIYRSAVRQFDERVRAIRPEQWALSTPDDGWDVHRLVRHVITGQLALPGFLGAASSDAENPGAEDKGTENPAAGPQRLAADASAEQVLAGWAAASAAASAAIAAIANPDQPIALPDGDTTAATVGWRLTTELTVHGWDLARAIGAPDEFPNDLLANVLDEAKQNAENWFPSERYRTPIPVPGCTDDLTELLALTGRNRWWRRPS